MSEIISFFQIPLVKEFIASYGATLVLDKAGNHLKNILSSRPLEIQVYNVINDTLYECCNKYNWEYDTSSITDTFIFSASELKNICDYNTIKEIVEKAIGQEVGNDVIQFWIETLIKKISAPENEWLYRAMMLTSSVVTMEKKSDLDKELNKQLSDNICKIECELLNKEFNISNLIEGVKTNLPSELWRDIIILLSELSLNSSTHGNATQNYIIIERDYICIEDNGMEFDINDLLRESSKRPSGGCYAYKKFIEKYPWINVKYSRVRNINYVKIMLPDYSFDINEKCKIDYTYSQMISINMIRQGIVIPKAVCQYYYFAFDNINEVYYISYSGLDVFISELHRRLPDSTKTLFVFFSNKHNYLRDYLDMIDSFYNFKFKIEVISY